MEGRRRRRRGCGAWSYIHGSQRSRKHKQERQCKEAPSTAPWPQWLWDIDVYSLSTPTAIIHSCPKCFNPQLPNPQIFPARSIAVASAQFQVRDPTVEREGPVTPLYGTYDCWQNPQSTPPHQPIVMPVHPPNIPLAPMYPPDFDFPTSVIDTPTP
eukprot:scaffold451_cov124-Isochrysis_galbana.AAC.6